MGNSSGVRDITLLVKCCLFFLILQVKLVWVVSDFRPSHNPTKLPPSAWVVSQHQEATDDVISPEDLAEVPVETGNRACFSLSCQPKTCHDQISDADFGVCPSTGHELQWEISNMSTDCCVWFRRLIMSYRIHAKSAGFARREDFPNPCFPRQTKRRQKDAKIPDSCFCSFPWKNVNLRCY